MNRSILTSLASIAFVSMVACSSDPSGNDLTSEDELRAANACAGKSCGDTCTLCPPSAAGCVETAVLKSCNSKGLCKAGVAVCAAPSPGPYDPCGGKSCGDACSVCPPGDPSCVETAVLKECGADGKCNAGTASCSPPPPPPPAYDACAGKTCGATCTLCDPADKACVETAVVKQCDAKGACTSGAVSCAAYDPCAGKKCGDSCKLCPPSDPGCVETAVVKQCNVGGACTSGAPACK